jgi:hypothetical protein
MDFESLGDIWQAGARLYVRCAKSRRDGLKSVRACGNAAESVGELSHADLRALLRRAALRIRNTESLAREAEAEQAIDFLAGEVRTARGEAIRTIVLHWLISAGRLAVDCFDEASETHGTA